LSGLFATSSTGASIPNPGPLKRFVRLCGGNQECYIGYDLGEGPSRDEGFWVDRAAPPRVVAFVEQSYDRGLRPPLLEGKRRDDAQIHMECPPIAPGVHDVERLASLNVEPIDLAFKGGRGACRD